MTIEAPWAGAALEGAGALVAGVVIVVYCVAGEPFVGRWLHHRMEREVTRDSSSKARGYHRLLVLECVLGAAALVLAWALPGIGVGRLGLRLPHPAASPVGFGIAVAAAALLLAAVIASTVAIWRIHQPIPVVGGDRVRVMVPTRLGERVQFLALALAAGVCEELLYRGLLLAVLAALLSGPSIWLVVVLGAVAFGAAHAYQGRTGTIVTALLGALLGAIYATTGSLLLVMLLHAALDARVGLLPARALRPSASREASA